MTSDGMKSGRCWFANLAKPCCYAWRTWHFANQLKRWTFVNRNKLKNMPRTKTEFGICGFEIWNLEHSLKRYTWTLLDSTTHSNVVLSFRKSACQSTCTHDHFTRSPLRRKGSTQVFSNHFLERKTLTRFKNFLKPLRQAEGNWKRY